MKNNKIPKTNTIKYNRYSNIHSEHTHIKLGIKKAVATCVTFSLVVSTMNYALALNKTNDTDNISNDTNAVSMPHEFVIANYSVNKDNYWTGNADDSRVFYLPVNLNELVEIEDEPEFTFYNSSVQYGFDKDADLNETVGTSSNLNGLVNSSSDLNSSKTKFTYRYAGKIHLTDAERYTVYSVLAGEVGSASYRDKLLVAQCFYDGLIYNKCTPKQLANNQYDGYKDFNKFKEECIKCNKTYYEDIIKAVEEVFDKGNVPVDEFILYFYGYKGYFSRWHETQKLVEETEVHRYFAQWKEIQM